MALLAALLILTIPAFSETRLSLNDAVRLAQEASFAVKAARHDSTAAALQSAAAGAERFPVLALKAQSYYVDKVQKVNFPFGSQEIGSADNYQADLTLTVPLYAGGRISNLVQVQKENSLAEGCRLESETMAAAYRSRRAYLAAMMSEAMVGAAAASLQRIDIIRRDVENLFVNGLADSLDILEAELALEKAHTQMDQVQTERRNSLASLARLVGMPGDTGLVLTESALPPETTLYPETGPLPEPDRPEMKRFDHVIAAADRSTALELAGLLPTLNGFAGYSYGMPNRDWFGKTWNDYVSAGMVLHWELNLGGKNSRRVGAARQQAASARMAQKELYDALLLQRDQAINDLRHAFQVVKISQRTCDLSRRQFNLAQGRQQAGRISVNRLLELEAELAAVEQQYHVSIISYYLAENEFFYAIGSPRIFGGL